MTDPKLEQMAQEWLFQEYQTVPPDEAASLTALLTRVAEDGKTHPTWSPEQIDAINAEMADGIINEIRGTLEELGCCHGHDMKSTPPMFYREAILCAIQKKTEERDAEWKRVVHEVDEMLATGWHAACAEIRRRMEKKGV